MKYHTARVAPSGGGMRGGAAHRNIGHAIRSCSRIKAGKGGHLLVS
ncbi:MAG: hypothetical protein LBS86_06560 [Treponema sp.]|nr:hypothetical protein [Treponema sp.]